MGVAGLTVRQLASGSWAVLDADGEKVSMAYRDHAEAEDRRQLLVRQSQSQTRQCLSCTKEFQSVGPGNRMCTRCRHGVSLDAQTLSSNGGAA